MVLMLHNSHLVNWPETIVRRIRADRYVFVSRYLQAEALGRFPWLGETAVLHNGADPAMFYPGPRKVAEGPPVVIFAGRLVPEKGLHIFVEAMRRLAERGVGAKGLVVGGAGFGGTAPTEYVRRMRKSAPSTVVFEAYCSGVAFADKLRAADIFCLPSCWEDPFPLAPIEAMACGLPVVSTRSGGIPEMFSAGGGILVERGSVEQLASVLELLIKDRGTRERLATEARACFVTRFTWEAVRKNYRDIVGGLAYAAATEDLDMLRRAGESAWEENESYS
jgi:spore coat protein SA